MASPDTKSLLKIITVDDSPIIVERLQGILAEIGDVEFAGNATCIDAALKLIEREKPQVVILDINLEVDTPNRNGIDLLILLRKNSVDVKIIMLTNLTEPRYRNTCLLLGADHFLDKSNEFEKIVDIVADFTKTYRNQ